MKLTSPEQPSLPVSSGFQNVKARSFQVSMSSKPRVSRGVHTHTHTHTSIQLDTSSVMIQWHVSNQEWEPTAFQKKKKRTEQGTMFQHHFMRTVLTNQQVHMTDQVVLPPLWKAQVSTTGLCPLQSKCRFYFS